MIVTEIQEFDKKRCKVFLDGQFSFVLYKGEIKKLGLSANKELPLSAYEQIMTVLLPKRAKLRAMNLLMRKTYTEKQLMDKLKLGFYPEEIIQEAIEYVKAYGYVDDYQYALDYITYQCGRKNKRRIEQDLMQKGIAKDYILRALEQAGDEGNMIDEESQIKEILRKKNYQSSSATPKERQKICASLYRKGYSMDAIQRALLLDIT